MNEERLYPMHGRSPDTERRFQEELLNNWVRRRQEAWRFLAHQQGKK